MRRLIWVGFLILAFTPPAFATSVFNSAYQDYVSVIRNADGSITPQLFVGGSTAITTVRNDYSSVNVTTGAWVQLIASTSAAISQLDLFDSSGQTLELGTGAAGFEVRKILIYPGGNGRIPLSIPISTRVAIRAVSATASTGELDINLLGN